MKTPTAQKKQRKKYPSPKTRRVDIAPPFFPSNPSKGKAATPASLQESQETTFFVYFPGLLP
jgi:hypothetical protein